MSSNNIEINKTIENFSVEQKEDNRKSKISKRTKIIIIVSVIVVVVAVAVTLIIIFATKKDDKKKPIIIQELTDSYSSIIFTDIKTTDLVDDEIDTLEYKDAEEIIGLESVKENHNLLNESTNNINKLLSFCNNTNLVIINASINDNPQNLEFLFDTNDTSLEVASDDLDLYISKYASLSEQTKTLSNEISEFINYIPLEEYKNENDNMTKQFEKNIQNLAIFFRSNRTGLRNLFFDELKDQIDKLNNFYKGFFNKTNLISEKLDSSIKLIFNRTNNLNTKVNDNIQKVNKIIESINNGTKIHEKLIEIKNISISLREDVDFMKNQFIQKESEISKIINEVENISPFINEERRFIANITTLLTENGKNDNDKNVKIEPLIESHTNSTLTTIKYSDLLMAHMNNSYNDFEISTVEVATSLDLLFIVDITGSMRPYLEEIKKIL